MGRFLRGVASSFVKCVIFFSLVFAIPEWLYFANDLYSRGMLTVNRSLAMAVGFLFLGAVLGAVAWWTIFKPLMFKIEKIRKLRSETNKNPEK